VYVYQDYLMHLLDIDLFSIHTLHPSIYPCTLSSTPEMRNEHELCLFSCGQEAREAGIGHWEQQAEALTGPPHSSKASLARLG
jgi:hypothetical protein